MATFHSGTDLEPLVTAAARGDAQAFATLVDHTSGLVTSIVLAVLRDLDATHDVAQEVFLAAWQRSAETQEFSELPAVAAANRAESLASRPAFTHPRPPLPGVGRR